MAGRNTNPRATGKARRGLGIFRTLTKPRQRRSNTTSQLPDLFNSKPQAGATPPCCSSSVDKVYCTACVCVYYESACV